MGIKVNIILSVDWEGNSLLVENLNAMKEFSEHFPEIPKIQFINPAYYSNLEKPANEVTSNIKSVFGPNDEMGLHIHPWERFIDASGVKYRNRPSYISGSESQMLTGLYGGDIPISAYSKEEILQIFSFGLQVLKSNGFDQPIYFRGGGWISDIRIRELIRHLGIRHDSSPVPYRLVANNYPDTPLVEHAKTNFPNLRFTDGPYNEVTRHGVIHMYPNNGCLADYVEGDMAFQQLKNIVDHAINQRMSEAYFHFGWHQETAEVALRGEGSDQVSHKTGYLRRVSDFLNLAIPYLKDQNIELVFPRLSQLALPLATPSK